MNTRRMALAVLGVWFVLAATLAGRELRLAIGDDGRPPATWTEVVPGVLRSSGTPHAYAIVDGSRALVIDLPQAELLDALEEQRITAETVLLTHHHRHTADGAVAARRRGISVRAPKAEIDLLTPEGVTKFWQDSVPLRNSRTAYFVLAEGIPGIDATLEDGQSIDWRGWKIAVLATPGHSVGHVSFSARRGKDGPRVVFCGDAMARPGTIWSPFTLEWDHWTDSGLKPAAESLRRLAALEPTILCPAHADPITKDVVAAIRQTTSAVEEVGYLKSFERYSDNRLGDAPSYRFLAPDQVASSGDKPWSQVSEHLFITGNTYVLASQTGKTMAIDLWGKRSIDQIQKLIADRGLAMPEVVWVSHAHYDHFDGIYEMPERSQFEVWTLDRTAGVLEEPGRFRAPFLDPRPMKVDRKLAPGDETTWQEYRFRIHHLPGQTVFTMGIETTIDGRRSLFTADNFFHMKQFSGSGGWTGLNRALPGGYAASARKILEIAPEWVLAEHGGPFEFNAEDFRRRAAWAESAAAAADRLSPSGDHRRDWDPHRVAIEPCHIVAVVGEIARVRFVVQQLVPPERELRIELDGRGVIPNEVVAQKSAQAASLNGTELSIQLHERTPIGRHMLPARVFADGVLQGTDTFVVVDVK